MAENVSEKEKKRKVGRPRLGKEKIMKTGLVPSQAEWLKQEAKRRGVSTYVILREALWDYMKRHGWKGNGSGP